MLNNVAYYLVLLFSLSGGFLSAQLQSRTPAPYRIQPGDQVQLSYRYTPEFDESLTVQPDGSATVKLIGNIAIGGLTVEEAKATLVTALKTKLNDPEITLTLTDYVKPSYVVVGQVAAPGKFELHGKMSAIEAIAIAGGFKDNALHSQVILFHRTDNDMARTTLLNMKRLMNPSHPHLDEDVEIQAGDMLVVPKNHVSKIADYVHWVGVGSYFPLY